MFILLMLTAGEPVVLAAPGVDTIKSLNKVMEAAIAEAVEAELKGIGGDRTAGVWADKVYARLPVHLIMAGFTECRTVEVPRPDTDGRKLLGMGSDLDKGVEPALLDRVRVHNEAALRRRNAGL